VNVKLQEGSIGRSMRTAATIQFLAVGTAVVLSTGEHRSVSPTMVVPLDDAIVQFEATRLRGSGAGT
jgi:hypothetical protein